MSDLSPINLSELDKPDTETHPLLAFGNWRTNVFVPPLLVVAVYVVNQTGLASLLIGFHVWVHEFGHATAAWMCGRKATPLPFGWTPVEPEYSPFVYFGLLAMFVILFAAGWMERKVWPMIAAVALAGLQYYMTWRMTEDQQEFWWSAFGGVGGEFYLSTLLMVAFYVQLPDKFKWGFCRYVFFLIGASAFLHIVVYWNQVYRGQEDIPMGSMIGGEDDENGDVNKLINQFDWTAREIKHNYQYLGYYCWAVLLVVYAAFALRLNLVADWVSAKFGGGGEEAGEA